MTKKLAVAHEAHVEIEGYQVTAEDWRLFLRGVPRRAVVTQDANGYGAILKAEWTKEEESPDLADLPRAYGGTRD